MNLKYVEMSFSEIIALKQLKQEQKIRAFRNLSDNDRKVLNERSAELCDKIAKEFGKSRSLVL